MTPEQCEGFHEPEVTKINEHVSVLVYKPKVKGKKSFVSIINTKGDEVQEINLLPGTLKKILKKLVD